MSYMKNSIPEAELETIRAKQDREDIERLRWELDRAVSNLVEALMRVEKRRNEQAGQQADELIKININPF
jgi:ABC-type arginine transport system ATPase subunit